jgi:hypothetical protein
VYPTKQPISKGSNDVRCFIASMITTAGGINAIAPYPIY